MRKLIILLALAVTMYVGYRLGIRHAILSADIWTVGNESNLGWEAYLELDGQVYVYDMYVG